MMITVIATGSSKWERFIKRWGVAFLIGEDVLFDTFGDPVVFARNLRRFHIDTAKIKHVILSHDDWDHVAGLWQLLEGRKDITVYGCPGFTSEIKQKICSYGVRFIEMSAPGPVTESVFSTGELVGETQRGKIYEQSVVVKSAAGLTVVCGCAHPGVVEIVRQVKKCFDGDINLLMGGFHLKDMSHEESLAVIKELQRQGIRRIAPMHCTGIQATHTARVVFGNDFLSVREGSRWDV